PAQEMFASQVCVTASRRCVSRIVPKSLSGGQSGTYEHSTEQAHIRKYASPTLCSVRRLRHKVPRPTGNPPFIRNLQARFFKLGNSILRHSAVSTSGAPRVTITVCS